MAALPKCVCYIGAMAFRALCGVLGAGLLLMGTLFFVSFFAYHAPDSDLPIPTGPVGFYFVAFTGCALVAWSGCLLAAAAGREGGRAIGSATALALVLSAVYRMAAWIVGDYSVWLGDLPRTEAAIMLVLALGFLWLRPARVAAAPSAT